MYRLALWNKNQFIKNGKLDMEHLLEKFVEHFDDIYGDRDEKFVEEDGRRYFMLYLKQSSTGWKITMWSPGQEIRNGQTSS